MNKIFIKTSFKCNFTLFILILIILIFETNFTLLINDVIIVGENNYRYINFVTTSKGIMFLETSAPGNYYRIYYGINPDGSGYFTNLLGEKTYILKKISENNNRDESEVNYIKINSNNSYFDDKEYLISISKNIIEFLDFQNINETFQTNNIENLLPFSLEYDTLICTSHNLIENNLNYFYLGYIVKNPSTPDIYFFILRKINFSISESTQTISANIEKEYYDYSYNTKAGSCFFTKSLNIVCLYYFYYDYEYENEETGELKFFLYDFYSLIGLNKDLEPLDIDGTLDYVEDKDNTYFFKAIHLRDEIGCIIYYISNVESPKMKIIGLDYEISEFVVHFSNYNLSLDNHYLYNSNLLLNDLIKVSNETACFSSSTIDKLKLIIVMINFYEPYEFTIRYYILNIYDLLNYKFLFDIKLHIFNNQHIAFASSVCPDIDCNNNEDPHFSILLFFNYPNSTEYELDVIDYLYNNTENYILFNISENGIIDNNIFGYIIHGTKIINICENNLNFIINGTENPLNENDIILKSELIRLDLPRNEYDIIICKIEYQIVITEPNYEIFNNYTDKIDNFYEENSKEFYWRKKLYYGKKNNYKIIFSNKILTY